MKLAPGPNVQAAVAEIAAEAEAVLVSAAAVAVAAAGDATKRFLTQQNR
jgi:hypothetical protein